jgi:hypothetical protein
MVSRLALVVVAVVVVACGGSKPPPAQTASAQPAESAPAAPASAAQPAPAEPGAEPAHPPPEPAPAAPAEKKPIYDRLRDTDGKIAGLAGFSIKRKADKTHCGGFAIVTTRAKKVAKEDEPLAAVFKIEFPKNLSFDAKDEKKKKASLDKFNQFLTELTQIGGDARKEYESKLIGDADQAVKIAAAARIAQIMTRLASVIARAEIPVDVRNGEYAEDKIKAYCDRMLEVAEPIQAQAELAMTACADKAKGAATGWWNEVCVAP